ncbi:Uncharacterised protein [uncultured Blautia sp.]|nr:Uncharacterised protein [uncultured Blautia sp.]
MSSHRTSKPQVYPCIRSHSRQIRSTTGVMVRRMAVISVVSMSACWELIRSVELQLSPSIKGGIPVLATTCSKICRTGTSLSRTGASAPMTWISTSPTATKSRTLPLLVSCMARDHSPASIRLRSSAWPFPSSRQVTAKRRLPHRSQLIPMVW